MMVDQADRQLGELIGRFKVHKGDRGDEILDRDVILLRGSAPRVVTGNDILGRLLRGIAVPSAA